MRVNCSLFQARRLCLVAAVWIAVSGCGFEQRLDDSSTSDTSETNSNAATPQADPLPAVQQPPVILSAGVALPQTGPTGTLMSFSVDYQFTQGGPEPTARYVWVIERSQGDPHQQPVQLNNEGTLVSLVPEWRPGEGPFESHIAEVTDEEALARASDSVPLR